MINNLKDKKIILASQSPRRHHLLKSIGVEFDILSRQETDEGFPEDMNVYEVPVFLARKKAKTYENFIAGSTILITADTIVHVNNKILNKPTDYDDAVKMLKTLSGNMHTVITGVCITTKNKQKCFNAETHVYFDVLDDDEIHYYIDKFKPFDKAGAYGIQEWIGYIGIKKIEGSYFNVMGLPVQKLYEELKLL
ncbi:MAG: Maf family nucleotide pyrophosphatase [Bacteroidales bacterium]|nr:Maf family nucleotide pyrophosphatase [Bacteroidales bacterium]